MYLKKEEISNHYGKYNFIRCNGMNLTKCVHLIIFNKKTIGTLKTEIKDKKIIKTVLDLEDNIIHEFEYNSKTHFSMYSNLEAIIDFNITKGE